MLKMWAAVLTVAATMTGIYAAAATMSSSLASNYNTTETESHRRSVAFTDSAIRASAAHVADRAHCDRLAAKKKKACYADAKFRSAREL